MASTVRLLWGVIFLVTFTTCFCWDNDELEIFDLVEEINANFYDVLGVAQDSSSSDIRKAYRKLSLQLHPDKNKADDAEEKFRQLVSIYEVLKDEEKRKRYDRVLAEGLPDWRMPVFYYRRARKMGLVELSAVLALIMTIGQYMFGWAVYFERRLTLEDLMDTKKKKEKKKRNRGSDEGKTDEIQEEIESLPRPRLLDLWPFRLAVFTFRCICNGPVWIKKLKEHLAERRRLKEEAQQLQQEVKETEGETDVRKPKRRKVEIPEYSAEFYEVSNPAVSQIFSDAENSKEMQREITTAKDSEWTEEELILLAKAVNKFPGGTLHRWEKIAEMVGRSVEEVTLKSKEIKGTYIMNLSTSAQGDILGKKTKKSVTINDNVITTVENGETFASVMVLPTEGESTSKRRHRPAKIPKTNERTLMIGRTQPSRGLCGESWTQNQQMIFEWALRHFPKGTDKRWDKIADQIPGKSKEDCILRFKFLAEIVKKRKEETLQS
ncbi:hypothetical protein C0Q70_09554 [Pomacea canaliculata]|uniref:DnaJ homolog subfamily C member 1 n=1 Tax=Pomacea canaliculata TaxID=400727 RepID=A0A2T7PA43_POMCA|nr:hypothetical protein C0Q70_09554 [Pomacea canaliculata]